MCGRFALINNPLLLMSLFDLPPEDGFRPVYNIAPSFRVLSAYKEDEKIVLGRKTWNFKPHWAKQEMKSVINARTETAFEKPYFRSAIKKHRCLVPATGFYEWKPPGPGEKGKTPVFIHPEDQQNGFLLGGVFEGDGLAICTKDASERMKSIHDRMPVIVPAEAAEAWLRSEDRSEISEIIENSADVDHAYPVSTEVNSPGMDKAELLEPAGESFF
ncbi:MAG: SOS response-associated peptidase [Leptospiraceae bacterium]